MQIWSSKRWVRSNSSQNDEIDRTHRFETSRNCCHQERFHMFITTPIGATSMNFVVKRDLQNFGSTCGSLRKSFCKHDVKNTQPHLNNVVFVERTRILSGIQFTTQLNDSTRWGRLWGLSTRPRDRVQNGVTTRYTSWANFSAKISTGFVKGCQSWKGNAGRWWQRCVTADLTDFGIGISEVRSLCGVDITGWAALLLTFPGGLACHGRINQLVGGNVMSLLTGGEQARSCSWVWSQSRPHQVDSYTEVLPSTRRGEGGKTPAFSLRRWGSRWSRQI